MESINVYSRVCGFRKLQVVKMYLGTHPSQNRVLVPRVPEPEGVKTK